MLQEQDNEITKYRKVINMPSFFQTLMPIKGQDMQATSIKEGYKKRGLYLAKIFEERHKEETTHLL